MGKLIYLSITSLDGYVANNEGNFDWGMPSEEVHLCVNDIVRNVGTSLIGRKMYEIMKVWETLPEDEESFAVNEFAKIWRASKKIIYSSSLSEVESANTTIERAFEAEAVRKLFSESDKDVDIGGPHLAAEAIKAGLVDEYHQIIAPIVLGGGNHWLPKDVTFELKLVDMQKFENGFVHIRYGKA